MLTSHILLCSSIDSAWEGKQVYSPQQGRCMQYCLAPSSHSSCRQVNEKRFFWNRQTSCGGFQKQPPFAISAGKTSLFFKGMWRSLLCQLSSCNKRKKGNLKRILNCIWEACAECVRTKLSSQHTWVPCAPYSAPWGTSFALFLSLLLPLFFLSFFFLPWLSRIISYLHLWLGFCSSLQPKYPLNKCHAFRLPKHSAVAPSPWRYTINISPEPIDTLAHHLNIITGKISARSVHIML